LNGIQYKGKGRTHDLHDFCIVGKCVGDLAKVLICDMGL